MNKKELIDKIKKTTSVVEFYKLKTDILSFLEEGKDVGKVKKKEADEQ